MTFDVRPGPDGGWQLVELRPVVVGQFAEEGMARVVATLLARELPPLHVVPAPLLPARLGPVDEEPPPGDPFPSPQPPAPSPQAGADRPGDAELKAMIQAGVDRVLAGEAIAAVAASIGVAGRRLSAAVGLRKRWSKPREAAPAAPGPTTGTALVALAPSLPAGAPHVSAAAEPQDACTDCGRPMVPTVANPDLCHRCRP